MIIIYGIIYACQNALWSLLKRQGSIKWTIWICIWGTFACIGACGYSCYREYERVIVMKCLLGIDKHDCGGLRAYAFWVNHISL